MTSLERFLKTCRCENRDRPPVWLMRQAGRYLPEYRAIRESHDFLEMLTDENLIVEISLQPWRRFQMDAVIVFSDILLLPHVMGMPLQFIEGQGPKFLKLIAEEKELKALKRLEPKKDIPFLLKAFRQIKKEIKEGAALIGFAGSPWTVASYMMRHTPSLTLPQFGGGRGGGDNDDLLKKVLERLTQETIMYLKAQIEAGVDGIQIFDSWGGVLSPEEYAIWSLPYIKEIVGALKPEGVPIIIYIKDSQSLLDLMLQSGCDVISVGWESPLTQATQKAATKKVAIQGNFNPHILMQKSPEEIRTQTQNMLKEMEGYPGYIANLGHGVLPKTPVENVGVFVETVLSLRGTK